MKTSLITYAPEVSTNGTNKSHSIKYILNPFINILESNDKQNTIEVINLDKMVIKECLGCSDDMFFVPKENCRQIDDMNSVYQILKDSELWFFAIESNSYTPPKKILNFLDRLEPLFNDNLIDFNGNGTKKKTEGKIFLLAVSSLWENGVFDELSFQIQSLSLLFNREIVGQILRPHYGAFIQNLNVNTDFRDQVFNQINNIATGIINSKKIEESTFQFLNTTVIDRDEYVKKFSEALSII